MMSEKIIVIISFVPSIIIFVELFVRLPLIYHVQSSILYSMKAAGVVFSPILKDKDKQKFLGRYAKKIFFSSVLAFIILIFLLSLFVFSFAGLHLIIGNNINYITVQILDVQNHILIFVIAVLYVIIRNKVFLAKRDVEEKEEYTFSEKILHYIALDNQLIKEMSYNIDSFFVSKKKFREIDHAHVFVTGLARSGTTILLESLYKTGEFSSLTYRNMPFVLAPYLWSKISKLNRKEQELKERKHGDRLLVNYDSPEAFDEIFWNTFHAKKYIRKTSLLPVSKCDPIILNKYKKFIYNTMISNKVKSQKRYLSKNNNNVLRINVLKELFPNSHIIIPFRNPVDHAHSLLNQHKRFLAIHNEDNFALEYMIWLGHYEFGKAFKPFKVSPEVIVKSDNDLLNLDYWIMYWCKVHKFILDNYKSKALFFSYDTFCENPQNSFSILSKEINLSVPDIDSIKNISNANNYDDTHINDLLLQEAQIIYKELLHFSINNETGLL